MHFLLKNRTHVIVAFLLLATIIFILHQMLTNVSDSAVHEGSTMKLTNDYQPASKSAQNFAIQYHTKHIAGMPVKLNEKFSGERLIHLDLKGAPPQVSYLVQLFPLFKAMGATGLLLEYEDMFPYHGELANIPAYNQYNASDISNMISQAKLHQLELVPLVQTFGHLEFVLKLEDYKDLREVNTFPQVICPSHNKSLPLISAMIDQVLALHPGVRYIHIGSDEVYHIGRCVRCSHLMAKRQWTKDELFLSHVQNVTRYIKNKYPRVRPIMWDDELRKLPEEMIREFQIPQLVEVMIWKYTPNVAEYITDDMLEKYSKLFEEVWIASAFKGATGPDSMLTNVQHHLENHIAWMEIVDKWKTKLRFRGIAITGWQRYDHFAVLCELLPIAIPSLAVCLQYLEGNDIDDNTLSTVLKCRFPFSWGPAYASMSHGSSSCSYPGSALYHLVHSFWLSLQDLKQMDKDVARGWLSWYNIITQFSNPSHVETATDMVSYHKIQMQYMEERLRTEMLNIYDEHTVDEWLGTFLLPHLTRLISISKARDKLLEPTVWPRRPLDKTVSVKKELEKVCDKSEALSCTLLGTFC